MVAGITGAVITAILMVFEVTWDYGAILPTMLTAVVAYAVRQHLAPAPAGRPNTIVVVRDGRIVGIAAGNVALGETHAPHVVVEPQDRLTGVLQAMKQSEARVALVMRSRESTSPRDLVGVITDREIAALSRSKARLME